MFKDILKQKSTVSKLMLSSVNEYISSILGKVELFDITESRCIYFTNIINSTPDGGKDVPVYHIFTTSNNKLSK